MFVVIFTVVAVTLVIMAAKYAEESNRILERWGFLCGKKDRKVRHPRIEVSQVGEFMKEKKCTLPWKDIQIDDQIVKLNGLSVENLENTQIRAVMLLSCLDNTESNDTDFSVEFTNADKQRTEEQEDSLSPKDKLKKRNDSRYRPSLKKNETFTYEVSLSPKERKAIRNKRRDRPTNTVTKINDGG